MAISLNVGQIRTKLIKFLAGKQKKQLMTCAVMHGDGSKITFCIKKIVKISYIHMLHYVAWVINIF